MSIDVCSHASAERKTWGICCRPGISQALSPVHSNSHSLHCFPVAPTVSYSPDVRRSAGHALILRCMLPTIPPHRWPRALSDSHRGTSTLTPSRRDIRLRGVRADKEKKEPPPIRSSSLCCSVRLGLTMGDVDERSMLASRHETRSTAVRISHEEIV